MVLKGNKSAKEVKYWIEDFQKTVNIAAGNQHLKFTAEICNTEDNSPLPEKEYRVQVVANDEFPFLDIKMSWSPEEGLQISVFRGERQQLK